jgi:hypothetical protein
LLLGADPTKSVEAFDKIANVILAGRVLNRGELAADH